jgi:hypothetical protein
MKLLLHFRLRALEAAVVVLCVVAYGQALFSTAIAGFWYGPDFENPP